MSFVGAALAGLPGSRLEVRSSPRARVVGPASCPEQSLETSLEVSEGLPQPNNIRLCPEGTPKGRCSFVFIYDQSRGADAPKKRATPRGNQNPHFCLLKEDKRNHHSFLCPNLILRTFVARLFGGSVPLLGLDEREHNMNIEASVWGAPPKKDTPKYPMDLLKLCDSHRLRRNRMKRIRSEAMTCEKKQAANMGLTHFLSSWT